MNLHDTYSGLSGLEQLRAMLASGDRPPISATLDFRLTEIEKGRAVVVGTPGAHAYNPLGAIHGGYAATMLDTACGCAVHASLSAEQAYTTLELKVSYHRGLTADSGPVRAEGIVTTIGRRVAFAEARLFDGGGRLCASASSTLLVFARTPEQ